jgi:hypothetical protein
MVTNDYGIVGGRDTEDDESYRYRIHLKVTSESGSNENAIRFALPQTPGIQDVVFDRRAGTFTCYVYAITPVAAASTLQAVQDTLDQTVAFPVTGVASNPDLVGITIAEAGPRAHSASTCTIKLSHLYLVQRRADRPLARR